MKTCVDCGLTEEQDAIVDTPRGDCHKEFGHCLAAQTKHIVDLERRIALAEAVVESIKASAKSVEQSDLVAKLAAYDAARAPVAHPEREERADAVPRPQMGERGVHTEAIDVMPREGT